MVGGKCTYCGQVFMVDEEDPDYITGGRCVDRIATLRCNCEGARVFAYREEQKEKANDNIDLAFNEYESMRDTLKAAVQGMVEKKFASITIKNSDGVTGKLSITGKGTIRVSKTVQKKVEFDE